MNSQDVGNRIAALRKEFGMTQQQLADKLCVTNKAVSKWETGEGYPDITILPTLASALETSIDELLCNNAAASEADADYEAAKAQLEKADQDVAISMALSGKRLNVKTVFLIDCALAVILFFNVWSLRNPVASLWEPWSFCFVPAVAAAIAFVFKLIRGASFADSLILFGLPVSGVLGALLNALEGMEYYPWAQYRPIVLIPAFYAALMSLIVYLVKSRKKKRYSLQSMHNAEY